MKKATNCIDTYNNKETLNDSRLYKIVSLRDIERYIQKEQPFQHYGFVGAINNKGNFVVIADSITLYKKQHISKKIYVNKIVHIANRNTKIARQKYTYPIATASMLIRKIIAV